ncbi:MAG: arogenate dehydrogenase, partial [Actinobacteria bacterium]|nr:arogenate dehydrogenase [Actinomycetota bacterium]
MTQRANVLGLGLIGGSVAAALRGLGWKVTGTDDDPQRAAEALDRGLIDAMGVDADSDVSFVAVPVSSLISGVRRMLA